MVLGGLLIKYNIQVYNPLFWRCRILTCEVFLTNCTLEINKVNEFQFLEQRRPPETAPAETSGRFIMEDVASLSESGNLSVPSSVCEKFPLDNEEMLFPESEEKCGVFSAPSSVYQLYETRMAALIRKNGMLEGQLAAALASREAAEKNASATLKSRQEAEKKLADTVKELELLKEKLSGMELAQEEANNLSNIVHSDNVRLEHDVAFLKAVLDDTQKVYSFLRHSFNLTNRDFEYFRNASVNRTLSYFHLFCIFFPYNVHVGATFDKGDAS